MNSKIKYASGFFILATFLQATGSWIWQQLLEHVVLPKVVHSVSTIQFEQYYPNPVSLLLILSAILILFIPTLQKKISEYKKLSVEYTVDPNACFIDPIIEGDDFNVYKTGWDKFGNNTEHLIGLYFSTRRKSCWFKVEFVGGGHPKHNLAFSSENGAMIHIQENVDGKRILISEQ